MVIIDDFHILGACAGPTKTKPVLVIDSYAVLSGTVAFQGFETIARRNTQIIEPSRHFQLPQFSQGDAFKLDEPPNALTGRQPLRVAALEGSDHEVE